MKSARILPVLLALGCMASPAAPAMAQADPESIGSFDDWQAVTFEEGDNKGCYITSKPTKEEGDYTQRGRVYVLVTHRPADQSFDVVSFVAGYAYEDGGEVTVAIDQTEFELFTSADSAWAPDTATDQQLVGAMKKGNQMVVKGTSSRGTLTTDTYSLSGFSSAYDAIAEACPR